MQSTLAENLLPFHRELLISKKVNHYSPPFIIKKNKLMNMAEKIMRHPLYQQEIQTLMQNFHITEQNVYRNFLEYNLDIFSPEGNCIYTSYANRIVLHIHNLVEGSWHIERQSTMCNLIELAQPKSIADIGFGVPSSYVKKIVLEKKLAKLTLCDLYEPAFLFAKALLQQWDQQWKKLISFKKTDMDSHDFVGAHDLYIFQDSVEHTPEPTTYLKKYVQRSPSHSKFLLSLPIGPIIPRHYIAWHTHEEAQKWLNECGLRILQTKSVYVNPTMDIFAEQLGADYHDLYVLCSKQ